MEVIVERPAALDVHNATVTACVRTGFLAGGPPDSASQSLAPVIFGHALERDVGLSRDRRRRAARSSRVFISTRVAWACEPTT